MPVASGSTFSGYSVLRHLGSGEMGEVYLAQHPRLPHWNALKVLSATLAEDREFRDRFMRETPIATSLYHPHILGVEYRGDSGGQLWVTMDYVNGTSAAQLVASRYPGGMPAGEVLAVVTAIADALDYANSRGMLHRSVKPANILFTNPADGEQQILLTDFGLARQLGDPDGAAPDLTGEMVAYAAPEQLMASDLDGRADQYSLAATAYFLLTGAPPFQQSNPVAVISQHLTAAPPNLRDRRPELARLDDVFARALAKNPRDRFASCRAFADALSHSAGAWTGDRSPEAYLTVVDYPEDDDALETQPAATVAPASAAASSFFPTWAKTVRRLAQHHATAKAPAAVAGSTPPAETRRSRLPWIIGLGTAAASLCLGLVAVGVIIGRGNDTGTLTATRSSAPKAAPPNKHNFPGPGEALDGSYRIDVNREHQVYNGRPDPQPPNVTTWWAFRTACTPKSCVATGAMLDESGHLQLSAPGAIQSVALDFRKGAWQSRPQTMQFACLDPDGTADHESTTQILSLQHAQGALSGTMTVTVETNECRQQGAKIEIPTVAARVAEVPAGVEVPGPPSDTPPPPAKPGR